MSDNRHVRALLSNSPYLPFSRDDLDRIEERRCSEKYVLARFGYQWKDPKGKSRLPLAQSLWEALHEIFDDATSQLSGQKYELKCASLKGEPGAPLSRKIILDIASADILFFDVAYRNPNVYFELGVAYALNRKIILLTPAATRTRLASDLHGLTTSTYQLDSKLSFDLNTEKHLKTFLRTVVRRKRELQRSAGTHGR
jgi:hypothetical protein